MEDLRIHDIGRHQAPIEQHGEEYQKRNNIPGRQAGPGQRVGKADGHHYIAGRAYKGDKERDPISTEHGLTCLKNVLVGRQAKLLGEERIAIGDQRLLVRKGRREQQQKWNDADQGKDRQNNIWNQFCGLARSNHLYFSSFLLE